MDKHAVRQTLDQLAAFLVVKGENAAHVRAMQHAARSELLATGRSSTLDELREQVPPGLAEMLRIPGLGAAKVRQIHESLAIESLAELEAAAGDGASRRGARKWGGAGGVCRGGAPRARWGKCSSPRPGDWPRTGRGPRAPPPWWPRAGPVPAPGASPPPGGFPTSRACTAPSA